MLFVGLLLLAGALIRDGGAVMRKAGPLIYPALFLLVAYSLSAGNAGTAFRYRTHVLGLLLCLVVVMRDQRAEIRADAESARSPRPPSPASRAGRVRPGVAT